MTQLQTERLTLRPLNLSDAPFMLEVLNDPEFVRYVGDRGVRTVEDSERYIADGPREMYERLGYGILLVELKDGTPVGICGLMKRDSLEDPDIGFAFLPSFRGKGYAFESASAVMAYGWNELGLERIAAICSPENEPSIKLLNRLGLKFQRLVQLPGQEEASALFLWTA